MEDSEEFLAKFDYEENYCPAEVSPPCSYEEIEYELLFPQYRYKPQKLRNKLDIFNLEENIVKTYGNTKYTFFSSRHGFSSSLHYPFHVKERMYYSITNYFVHEKLRFFGQLGDQVNGHRIEHLWADRAFEIGKKGIDNFDEKRWSEVSIKVC